MSSIFLIRLLAVLVLANPVLSKFVPMTAENEPDRLKRALKFDNGRVYVDDITEFYVEPENGGYEFHFDPSCIEDINIYLGSYFIPVSKFYLLASTGIRNLIISTADGSVSGSVKVDRPSGEFTKKCVLLRLVFFPPICRVELVRGTPLVDLSDGQLIGGLTKLQFALIIVLPVVGAVLLGVAVVFLIVKKVIKNEKRKENEQGEKVKPLE